MIILFYQLNNINRDNFSTECVNLTAKSSPLFTNMINYFKFHSTRRSSSHSYNSSSKLTTKQTLIGFKRLNVITIPTVSIL